MADGDLIATEHSIALHSGEYVERYSAKPLDRVRNLVPRMKIGATTRIADFACGNGMLLQAIDGNFASYDGVDFSSDFIAAATSWAERTDRQRYRFHCCDIRDFCARNPQTFDVAATLDFSEHVDDALALEIYAAIRGSLRPGGRLYLHTPNLDFFLERAKAVGVIPQFPEHIAVRNGRQTADLLAKAGFTREMITSQVIPHYNVLRWIHPLAKLPLAGPLFSARLWLEAIA